MTNYRSSALTFYNGLGDGLTEQLRNAILVGQLVDGQRIIEREVADQFGTSRGPVRDALRQLAAEGLVISQPRRGTRVASLRPEDGEEIMAIRQAIEPLAVLSIVNKERESYFGSLHEILDDMRQACEKDDWAKAIFQDFALHREFYLLSGRRRLLGTWDSISAPLLHIFRLNRQLYESIDQIYVNHSQLVAEIESGDPIRAEVAVREHLTHFQPQLLGLMCKFEESNEQQ